MGGKLSQTLPDPAAVPLFRQAAIPVVIVTGFLGSGKTTLIRDLLTNGGLTDTAIIVSEFGEIGLDHLIVREVGDQIVLLENGCLCCGQSGDLAQALRMLLEESERGGIPPFARVVIETSGLADPLPILQTFLADPLRFSRYRPASIVTVVDAVLGVDILASHDTARRQLALADRVIVTKLDLPAADLRGTTAAISGLTDTGMFHSGRDTLPWQELFATIPSGIGNVSMERLQPHSQLFHTRSARIETDLDPVHLSRWIARVTGHHGAEVLRVKGLLPIVGEERPVILQMSRHLVHQHQRLTSWPEGKRHGFVTIICDGASTDLPAHLINALDLACY